VSTGLDYIPFMLHNIEERRKHFEKSSYTFLVATVVVGIILSIVVVFFGYILVNDEAAGTPRTLSQIREESSLIRRDLNSLLPIYMKNSTFDEYVGDSIKNLENAKITDLNENIKTDVQQIITEAKKTGDIATLTTNLQDIEKKFNAKDEDDVKYLVLIKKLNSDIFRFSKTLESTVPNLKTSLDKLDTLTTNVNNNLGKSDSQTGEVLKRLAVSLIVSSFFLAILRYASSLYRNNYQEMLRAQQDDLGIRRFYVAYKSSKSDNSTRGQILSKFINTTTQSEKSSDNSFDISKDDVSTIIKELLSLLTKKS
jgi:predicted PurR-regulated permease PerM